MILQLEVLRPGILCGLPVDVGDVVIYRRATPHRLVVMKQVELDEVEVVEAIQRGTLALLTPRSPASAPGERRARPRSRGLRLLTQRAPAG